MLSLLFFGVCFSFSICLFLGGVADQTKPTDLSFPVFLALAAINLVLFILFIFTELRFFKIRINIPLIIILSSLFIINLIVIATTPLENTFEYIHLETPKTTLVVITNEDKIVYIIAHVLLLLNIYISFNYLVYHTEFKKQFAWICCLMMLTGFIFIIYSYIKEWETYLHFLQNMATTLRTYNPKSFTNNQNSFAAILLGTQFVSYAMYAVTKKNVFLIIGVFFAINVVFPMSRVCLLLSIALSLIIFGYKMTITWKGHQIRNINLIVIVVALIAVFIVMYYNVPEINDYIDNVVLTNDSSIKSRIPLWKLTFSLVKDFHVYIGLGHGYFNTVFSTTLDGSLKMPHNLYVQTYGACGILGLVLFGCLILFAIYKIIRLFMKNRDAAYISIIGLLVILTYYLVEG